MPALVPKGRPDAPQLVVADDQVDFWTGAGYVLAEGQTASKPAKKATSKRASSAKK